MLIWSKICWTEANQILAFLDDGALDRRVASGTTPKDYFDVLVRVGALELAVHFLGIALSGHLAVGWAFRTLSETRARGTDAYRDELFDKIALWLDRPSDDQRREIWTVATRNPVCCPERLLAGAVYFSGGSIAPTDQVHLAPPPEISGRLASDTVIGAARATRSPALVLRRALELGEAMASAAY